MKQSNFARFWHRFVSLAAVCSLFLIVNNGQGQSAAKPLPPDNTGAIKLISASWFGSSGEEEIVGCQIGTDHAVYLAGNAGSLVLPNTSSVALTSARHDADESYGFLLRLDSTGGRILKLYRLEGVLLRHLRSDAKGNLYLLGETKHALKVGATEGSGIFAARLTPDASHMTGTVFQPDMKDFGIDSNGDIVTLAGTTLTRYAFGSPNAKWTAHWQAQGDNRPGGVTVAPQTGTAVVVGYGMTSTGREPYKDPYAVGFDRNGKTLWTLWNQDPKREQDSKFGGNGLMADTTGYAASVDGQGRPLLLYFADGGNTVGMRDPFDLNKPLAASVLDGVFQKTAGFGFKGASKTSLLYKIDPATGAPQKATWMCAWINPARANALQISTVTGDAQGHVFAVGNSAYGCPTLQPWFVASPEGYKGGGFLACFDAEFKMQQCGYFPDTTFTCVSCRDGLLIVAGTAGPGATDKTGAILDPTPLYHPLQSAFGGGKRDGYFAIFKTTP